MGQVDGPNQEPTAQQGLAQAGLEVQAYNMKITAGRIVGLFVAAVLIWFVVGPALTANGLALIGAIFVLVFAGILLGQWAALLMMRRSAPHRTDDILLVGMLGVVGFALFAVAWALLSS